MQIPVLTDERIQSIVQSEVAYLNSWLMNMEEQFDNCGIQIARFGNACAFALQRVSENPTFNRVIGLTTQDEGHIDSILQWYSENKIPCRIDLCPYQTNRDLLLSLIKHGLRESDYGTVLYGVPSPHISPLPPHIIVRKVHQRDLDLFSDLYAQGFIEFYGGSETNVKLIADSAKVLYGHPGWHLYLAFVEEIPAAVALLHIQDQIAVLVAATTVPQLRGKGCQTALIQQRIADAANAGCTLLVTQTRAGTISQRNMEHAGLRIAYNRAVWERLS
jgi:hypothetical protein